MLPAPLSGWKRATVALLLFGVSFGYVEAAVVAYLRALGEPVRERFYPGRGPDDLFPLLKLEQLEAGGPELLQVLKTEFAREAATLVRRPTSRSPSRSSTPGCASSPSRSPRRWRLGLPRQCRRATVSWPT